ncbi:MAG: hypothetical protein P8Q26_12415 [Ascidiaceihabitans sp.]|nr:hypothetical protein [Ascidiaceihabitans sp.]
MSIHYATRHKKQDRVADLTILTPARFVSDGGGGRIASGAKRGTINTMIGVVLWKNTDDGSAVIWCEDQGDLAFLNNKETVLDTQAFFDVGDVVEFDVLMLENMRGVQNLSRLQDQARPELGHTLSRSEPRTSLDGAEII